MPGLVRFLMIAMLVISWKALHLIGIVIVDSYGLMGALAACAICYCASMVIDR